MVNFIQTFHDKNDKEQLITYVDELISMYGYPCILRHFTGNKITSIDPLYQDNMSNVEINRNSEDYQNIETYVYIDYKMLDDTLKSYGLALTNGTSLDGIMSLDTNVYEDDIVQILYPMNDITYTFKVGSVEIDKDICYKVVLNVYIQDVNPTAVLNVNEPVKEGKPAKQIRKNTKAKNKDIIRI